MTQTKTYPWPTVECKSARWFGTAKNGYVVSFTKEERQQFLDGAVAKLIDGRYAYIRNDKQHIRTKFPTTEKLKQPCLSIQL